MVEYYITYEYIDDIDPADTPNHIETYTDVVREDHMAAFIEAGQKRSPDHFKIISQKRYYGADTFLPMNLGSGFNISIKNRHYKKERIALMEDIHDYLYSKKGTLKGRQVLCNILSIFDDKRMPSQSQLALAQRILEDNA